MENIPLYLCDNGNLIAYFIPWEFVRCPKANHTLDLHTNKEVVWLQSTHFAVLCAREEKAGGREGEHQPHFSWPLQRSTANIALRSDLSENERNWIQVVRMVIKAVCYLSQ